MPNDYEDINLVEHERRIKSKISSLKGYKEWYQSTFGTEAEWRPITGMQPYSIGGTTAKQEEALRGLAKEYGFEDLRGFNKFMQAAHVDYYDLIKIASP